MILLIDHGNSLNIEQLQLTKRIARTMIQLLNVNDKLAIIGISNDINVYTDPVGRQKTKHECKNTTNENLIRHNFYTASDERKTFFNHFVDNLNKTKGK